jgi:hypothetical protein
MVYGERAMLRLSDCNIEAETARAEAVRALGVTMDQTIAALRAETELFQEIRAVLEELEALQQGSAPLQQEIERVRRDLRPNFPPALGRVRRLNSGLMRPWFPVSISMQIPAA